MWILIIIAVHANDAKDIPGRVEMIMPNQAICQQAIDSMRWDLKFKSFRVEARCEKRS
jgi:hypothetical protein